MELTKNNIFNWIELVKKNCLNGNSNAVYDNLIGMFSFYYGDCEFVDQFIFNGDYSFFNDWERVQKLIKNQFSERYNIVL